MTLKTTFLLAAILLLGINTALANDQSNTKQLPPGLSELQNHTYISGLNFTNKRIEYGIENGLAIFEGDIILGTVEEAEQWQSQIAPSGGAQTRSVVVAGDRYRWPNNILPYQFDVNASDDTINQINRAIDHWEQTTNMRFQLRTQHNAAQFPDYVHILTPANIVCNSYVGRISGRQVLNLHPRCGFGAAVHELGHALGLWHEQSREDRNNFVQINFDNVQEGREHNFNQHIHDGNDIGPYDYGSIMHYGAFAFTRNGLPTITPLVSGVVIGQRNGLSQGDIDSINSLYPQFEPVARLNSDSYSVYLGTSVFLDGRNSFDPEGGSLVYEWNLGDGTHIANSNLSYIEYTYSAKGSYQATLTVEDTDGNTSSESARIHVYDFADILPAVLLPII